MKTAEEIAREITQCVPSCRACIKNGDICTTLEAARLALAEGRRQAFEEVAKEVRESKDLTGWTEIAKWAEEKAKE